MHFFQSFFSKKRIYLDYAGATPVSQEAQAALSTALNATVGNPGALHKEAVRSATVLEGARADIALELGCKPRELIFTSGGTEANNLAIIGYARHLLLTKRSLGGTHWVVSAIEHPSVLSAFGEIERMGGTVSWVAPNEVGIITPESVGQALKAETVLVSVGWANSEIGTVQPIARISRVLREHERDTGASIVFHSDAGQAPVYLPTTVHTLGADLVTFDSGKFYGPRGIGVLYVGKRVQLSSILFGGSQERGLRPGTENVALAAGMAAAFTRIARTRVGESARVEALRDALLKLLQSRLPELVVNGDIEHSLPHMLNVSIPRIQSEYIVLALDYAGIAISTKSACREGEERRSHVVEALGGEAWRAETTLRFSLGADTSSSDIQKVADTLARIVHRSAQLGGSPE